MIGRGSSLGVQLVSINWSQWKEAKQYDDRQEYRLYIRRNGEEWDSFPERTIILSYLSMWIVGRVKHVSQIKTRARRH